MTDENNDRLLKREKRLSTREGRERDRNNCAKTIDRDGFKRAREGKGKGKRKRNKRRKNFTVS